MSNSNSFERPWKLKNYMTPPVRAFIRRANRTIIAFLDDRFPDDLWVREPREGERDYWIEWLDGDEMIPALHGEVLYEMNHLMVKGAYSNFGKRVVSKAFYLKLASEIDDLLRSGMTYGPELKHLRDASMEAAYAEYPYTDKAINAANDAYNAAVGWCGDKDLHERVERYLTPYAPEKAMVAA